MGPWRPSSVPETCRPKRDREIGDRVRPRRPRLGAPDAICARSSPAARRAACARAACPAAEAPPGGAGAHRSGPGGVQAGHASLRTAGPLLHRSAGAEAAGRRGLRRRRRLPGSSASSSGDGGCCCGGSAPLPFSPCRTRGSSAAHLGSPAQAPPPHSPAIFSAQHGRLLQARLPRPPLLAQPRLRRAHPARPPPPPSAHDEARCRPLPRAWPPSPLFSRRSSSVGPGLLRPWWMVRRLRPGR